MPADSSLPPPSKRWLVLAHAFNMDGRAASQTITDKLPHLRAAGIEVVVISGVTGQRDREVEHHQLWSMGPAAIRFELRHVLRKRLRGPLYRIAMSLASLLLLPGIVVEKLVRPVENSWSWWLGAYLKGRSLMRQRHFDLIYSTGGAFSAHVAGRALRRSTGVPWLAEVHDPFLVPGEQPRNAQEKMKAEVERLICRDADLAIWFTEEALASARRRHPELGDRGRVMLPGVEDPFAGAPPPYVPGPVFVLGHFGSLSPTRNLGVALAALERMFAQHPSWKGRVELHVYGGPLDAVSAERLKASGARFAVRHFGRVEADAESGLSGRAQILRRMRSCDALLLLHGEDLICAEYIPSKMYEYLWMQRPILAMVHRNAQMERMLQGLGHCVVRSDAADPSSASERLASGLQALVERWERRQLTDSGQRSPFTTAAGVHSLVSWLADVGRPLPRDAIRLTTSS